MSLDERNTASATTYGSVGLTEGQMELLRRILDEAATGYAESNPRVRLLRIVEQAQRDMWGS